MSLKEVILQLEELNGIKFGSFKLKNGLISPVYFDLRVIISKPQLMKSISNLLWGKFQGHETDLLCGVPYTALPLATIISLEADLPMLIRRKEMKQYGTKKLIEGDFKQGQNCLIIEDVITSGSSVIETAQVLKNEGLEVTDTIVFLDREQGGKLALENNGIKVHSVTTVTEMLEILFQAGKVSQDQKTQVEQFIHTERPTDARQSVMKMSIEERGQKSEEKVVQRLFKIMAEKKSNLCLALDVTKSEELLNMASILGPYICCLKTHVDILADWDPTVTPGELQKLAKMHSFLLFEDRKLADIGNTVSAQFHQGLYNISSWADLVTVHGLPGPGLLASLSGSECKALIVAEMSSQGNLASKEYAERCAEMAVSSDSAIGVVSQSRLNDTHPGFVQMTPGVQFSAKGDALGQCYNGPEKVILEHGADVIIVGRGITKDPNPAIKALEYQTVAWNVLTSRFVQ